MDRVGLLSAPRRDRGKATKGRPAGGWHRQRDLRLPGVAARQQYSVQGEPCTDDSQCIGADILFCAYHGLGSASAASCAPVGGSCFDDAGCCGPASCYRGHCWAFFRAIARRGVLAAPVHAAPQCPSLAE
jgi:hypothetical protein